MSFIRTIYQAMYSNLIADGAYVRLIKGCVYTVLIFALALIIGFALAAVLSFFCTSEKSLLKGIGIGITFLMKTAPVYLALYLWYYTFLGTAKRGALLVSVFALGVYAAGQLTDIYTRSIRKEAAMRSETVNRRARSEFFRALLPFTTEQSLFEIKRLCGILLQMTTLVGLVGVNDVASVLIENGFKNRAPFFAIGIAILFYIVVQLILEGLFAFLAQKLTGEEE